MSARVDRVIEKIRAIHQLASTEAATPEEVDYSDVIIFSHGHFTRSFIARWCQLPIAAGYNFSSDAGGVSVNETTRKVLMAACRAWIPAHVPQGAL